MFGIEKRKWKKKQWPKNAWKLSHIVDLLNKHEKCDWCGTYIRYAHNLVHRESGQKTMAGFICASALTLDVLHETN